MRRFKFTLEPVLDHRERIEDEKQQIFAQRQNELRSAEAELARLNGDFKRFSTALRDDHASLSSEELRWHYAHLEYLDRCIVMQHATITQRRSAVDRARTDLVEASKDRKVIETLKDKKREEYRVSVAYAEQAELDDANNRRRNVTVRSYDSHPQA